MRRILVLDAQGGSGKSTIATNLAGFYAVEGANVALADFDPRGVALDWAARRPRARPRVRAIAAAAGPFRAPRGTEYLIMDGPAGAHGDALAALVRRGATLLVPVLPAAAAVRAAAHFVEELLLVGRVSRRDPHLAVVANRVPSDDEPLRGLERFLGRLGIPYAATLRESGNYRRAADSGLSLFELAPSLSAADRERWQPLLNWLERGRRRVC